MTNSCHMQKSEEKNKTQKPFKYQIDQFADLKILRYQLPDCEQLSLQEKKLIYYLSEATLCGRDILYDQFYKHNLLIRKTLEAIYENYAGDKNTEAFQDFETYLKQIWFSNGIHHHYSTDKIFPGFSKEYFRSLLMDTDQEKLPMQENETLEDFAGRLTPILFDPGIASKRVNQDQEKGLIKGSANNFYENLTAKEAIAYYEKQKTEGEAEPVEYGHNTKLIKQDGQFFEKTWKIGGMYSKAIEQILFWLEKAKTVALNETQETVISQLIRFYQSGNLKDWDNYNISWVKDTSTKVDFINGFIEVYGDPLGMKGTWEALVNYKDEKATERTRIISQNAQWFEDHSPVAEHFKKKEVKGVSAKVINVAMLGGDVYPSSPIGINLPNSDWIRKEHGSKSVTLANIIHAHHQSSLHSGMIEEFAYSDKEIQLAKKHGALATDMHVDLHEILGHGSGQLLEGISADDLKNYHSTIEEARADLFALYYIMDPKLVELGLIPSLDVGKVEYSSYIRGGMMTQLTRIEPGKNIEEAHMRNRQLIAQWAYELGQKDTVISKIKENDKTYFIVNDHQKLRSIFGRQLSEIQRIKSEGDFEKARKLVETYGIKTDPELHAEVLDRFKKLNLAPYTGFVNPYLEPVKEGDSIIDINVRYEDSYTKQMLYYGDKYSFLDTEN